MPRPTEPAVFPSRRGLPPRAKPNLGRPVLVGWTHAERSGRPFSRRATLYWVEFRLMTVGFAVDVQLPRHINRQHVSLPGRVLVLEPAELRRCFVDGDQVLLAVAYKDIDRRVVHLAARPLHGPLRSALETHPGGTHRGQSPRTLRADESVELA
jgi:hypothetical protein